MCLSPARPPPLCPDKRSFPESAKRPFPHPPAFAKPTPKPRRPPAPLPERGQAITPPPLMGPFSAADLIKRGTPLGPPALHGGQMESGGPGR